MSNKIGESGIFYTNDIAKLAMRAISSCIDDFLRIMQIKFSDISENGRSLMLQIAFDENSKFTMESEVGTQGLLLQDEIELWVEAHSFNGDYHLQGVSPIKMIFDDIHDPLDHVHRILDVVGGFIHTDFRFDEMDGNITGFVLIKHDSCIDFDEL